MKLLICTQVVDKQHPVLGFFHSWLLEFAKYFEHIDVICLEEGVHTLPAHVTVYSLGKDEGRGKPTQLLTFYSHFISGYRKRPDFVFFHMGAIMNVLAAPLYLLKKIQRRRTTFVWWKAHGHINWFGRLALLCVDQVATSTESGFPIRTRKRRVIGQAIDTKLFTCRQRIETGSRLLYAGRVSPIKRIEYVLAVAAALRALSPHFTCKIIGAHSDEEYMHTLRMRCDELLLSRNILVGPRPQSLLVQEYCNADFFINPSETHSMDKTVLEAMSCGVLPLTSNKAFERMLGPHELYHEHNDTDWYKNRIIELMSQDTSELRTTLAETVRTEHGLDTFTARLFPISNTNTHHG